MLSDRDDIGEKLLSAGNVLVAPFTWGEGQLGSDHARLCRGEGFGDEVPVFLG